MIKPPVTFKELVAREDGKGHDMLIEDADGIEHRLENVGFSSVENCITAMATEPGEVRMIPVRFTWG
jgi:hypothetical protein